MMSLHSECTSVCILAVLLIAGCGSGTVSKARLEAMAGGKLKEVVPVSGKVIVDGQPVIGVLLELYPDNGDRRLKSVVAGADGTYCWSNYTPCDGLEPGRYKLTFKHLKNPMKEKSEDLFNGRFSKLSETKYELTVEAGKPQKDVDYNLSTK